MHWMSLYPKQKFPGLLSKRLRIEIECNWADDRTGCKQSWAACCVLVRSKNIRKCSGSYQEWFSARSATNTALIMCWTRDVYDLVWQLCTCSRQTVPSQGNLFQSKLWLWKGIVQFVPRNALLVFIAAIVCFTGSRAKISSCCQLRWPSVARNVLWFLLNMGSSQECWAKLIQF